MSQAEELLNNMSDEDIALYTVNPETEEHIIITNDRYIVVPDMLERIAVQYDNNVETVTFDCPRYWDEIDLSTMNIYINYVRSDNISGLYMAKNIRVDEEDSNIIHFDWMIGDEITIVSGSIQFSVSAKKINEDEELRWYSEINDQMTVSKSLDSAEVIVEEYPDIINELATKMDNLVIDNDVKTSIKTLQTDLNVLEEKVDGFVIPEQVQVDWNQNDATQPDYIKNRICYEDNDSESVLIEEVERTFEYIDMGGIDVYRYTFADEEKLIVDNVFQDPGEYTLKIMYDGNEYTQSYVLREPDNYNATKYLSDGSINELMGFIFNLEYIEITTPFLDGSVHTVGVKCLISKVIPIPEKYLPDTVATKEYVNNIFNSIVNGDEVSY